MQTDSTGYRMFTDLLFDGGEMSLGGFFVLYLVVLVLSIVAYQLGFARKLPLLKQAIVYVALAIGAFPVAFLGIALPLVEALLIGVILLAFVRWRFGGSRDDESPGANKGGEADDA